jgi:predicted phage tail protein
MLRKIRLYGALAKFIGKRVLKAEVATAAEAVRFLVANFPEVERHMADRYYKVMVGEQHIMLNELHYPAGQQEIKIIPMVAGSGPLIAIPIGALLIGAGAVGVGAGITIAGVALSTILFGVGISLVLGGVAQLLTPTPKVLTGGDTEQDPRKSYSFSGIQNTSRQGTPVPIVYGETIVGSIVISAGIDTVQVMA